MESDPASVELWKTADLDALIEKHEGILAGAAVAIADCDFGTAAGMLDHLAKVCAERAKRNA